MKRTLLIGAGLLALSACSSSELGSQVDNGSFGNATMNNTLLQSGEISVAQALGERFASEVSPVITFAFNSAQLTPDAQAVLVQQANWIRQFPEVRFRVYGHTDLVGSNAYNKQLGLRRAQAVVAFFETQGISRSRVEAVASFGETQPVIYTQNPEERNRRTVTEVIGFVSNHPSVLNGRVGELVYREYVEYSTRTPHAQGRDIEAKSQIWPSTTSGGDTPGSEGGT
jgi:outer membrane protein OmpA-like peptidoglycan-associated protein